MNIEPTIKTNKTLLEKAMASSTKHRVSNEITSEQIELAIAFIEDKVSMTQVSMGLELAKGYSPAPLLLRYLRRAVSQGKLVVVK